MSARTLWGISIAAGLALACESTPPPRNAIAQAEEAISRAKARDAAEHAPLQLRQAEDKLAEARAAARDDDEYGTARRLAEQAEVDAQLALAESEEAQAKENFDELSRTVRALEEEIQHDQR
jgi:Domain of unknown function (DUF4398)